MAPPPPASSQPARAPQPRVVRFGDGIATVEPDGVTDHVVITDKDGKLRSDSWCPHETAEYDAVVRLFTQFRGAIANHDRQATAELLRYPFRVSKATRRTVANSRELVARFDEIFTTAVIAKILKTEPQGVFCRNGSASLGDGVLWAHLEDGLVLVDVLNR